MRIAYLDCFSGISGDMFLGALLDAGVPLQLLRETVAGLNIGATLELSRVDRGGISAAKLDVIVNGERDMPREEYWAEKARDSAVEKQEPGAGPQGSGGTSEQRHRREHAHHYAKTETADPSAALRSGRDGTVARAEGFAHAPSRGLNEILKIISAAPISERARQTANEIFLALGAAEAKVHNARIGDIHFHEVGAADAIVDIVCAAVGAEALGVDEFYCSPLNVGGGTVACAHGVMPIPAPATLELLKGAQIYSGDIQKELVTPTGAAIVKVIVSSFGPRPLMTAETIGYGAGTRDFSGHSNVLRITVGETIDRASQINADADLLVEEIAILEANLDDLNPQLIGYIAELALGEGALDVFTAPVQMKKNRPGTLLTVLSRLEHEEKLRALLFRESSTLGVRTRHEKRHVLARRHESVTTPWGEVRMKVASLNGTVTQYAPEYEDCRRIASGHHLPLKTVMQEAIRLYLDRKHE